MINETGAKLRELARLHPPGVRTVGATRYGITGVRAGNTKRDKLAYARQYYRDNKQAINAAQREKCIRTRAQAARDSKKARAR